jgi:hypothetical protein
MQKIFWFKKFCVVAMAAFIFNPWSFAQTFTLIFDSGDDVDTVEFDPAKISDSQLGQLMYLSPYIVGYFSRLEGRDITAAGSQDGDTVDKVFLALNLEQCVAGYREYAHCDANAFGGPNFLRNAKTNVERSKRGLAWLQNVNAPKELDAVMKFLVVRLEFSVWTEETKLKYYSTWDDGVLKEAHEGIEPAKACSESLTRLEAAKSTVEKYELVRQEWTNCMVDAISGKMGKYPIASWEAFLRAYGIRENFKQVGPD